MLARVRTLRCGGKAPFSVCRRLKMTHKRCVRLLCAASPIVDGNKARGEGCEETGVQALNISVKGNAAGKAADDARRREERIKGMRWREEGGLLLPGTIFIMQAADNWGRIQNSCPPPPR